MGSETIKATIRDHPIGFEITTEAIRIHNRKLMKYLLFILGVDLILMFISMVLNEIYFFNLGAGSGITIGVIALWIANHHPKYSFERKGGKTKKKIINFLLVILMGCTVIMAIGTIVTYLLYVIFNIGTELSSEILLLSTIVSGVATAGMWELVSSREGAA